MNKTSWSFDSILYLRFTSYLESNKYALLMGSNKSTMIVLVLPLNFTGELVVEIAELNFSKVLITPL